MDIAVELQIYAAEQELDKNPEGKLFTCMDMKGTKLSMFAGEVKVCEPTINIFFQISYCTPFELG